MRRISDRYIFGELIAPFLVGTLAVLIMLVGNTLFGLLNRLMQEKWPIALVVRLLVLNIPTVMVYTLPVSTALAASLATNRMARDNEITVLRGAGLPLFRIFLPVVFFGILSSAATLYLSNSVVPWAWKEQQDLQAVLYNLPKNPVYLGRTIQVESYTISFNTVQKISDNRLRLSQVVVVDNPDPGSDKYGTITTAKTADYEGGVWYLKSIVLHHYNDDGMTFADAVAPDGKLNLRVDFTQVYTPPSGDNADKASYSELTRLAVEARRLGQVRDALGYEVNRWFKLSLPLMCLVFALCAPPLSMRFARAGSFTGVLLSIIVVFIAWNTLLVMKAVGLGGYLPPVVAAWTTNALFVLLGLWLLRTQE